MLKEYNKAGQRTPHWKGNDYSRTYTPLDIEAFEFLHWHGMANRPILYHYLQDHYKNEMSLKNRALRWRERDFITLDTQQLSTPRAASNFLVYSPTERLRFALMQEGRFDEDVIPLSGGWLHRYLTAAITSSIHAAAKHKGVEYIPGHKILKGAPLECPDIKLKPDQMFGLKYPDGTWRLYFLEAERVAKGGTTGSDKKARKNYRDNILTYQEYIEGGKYRDHLGVNTGAFCLYVFATAEAEYRFKNANPLDKCGFILTQRVEGFMPFFVPQPPYLHLFNKPWQRHGMTEWSIKE